MENKNEYHEDDSKEQLFQCKFCDQDFPNTTAKEGHEKKYHPTIHPDENTIMEDYSSDQTEN